MRVLAELAVDVCGVRPRGAHDLGGGNAGHGVQGFEDRLVASAPRGVGEKRSEGLGRTQLERDDGALAAERANALQRQGGNLERRSVVAVQLGHGALHGLARLGQALREQRRERQVAVSVTPYCHVGVDRARVKPSQGGAHELRLAERVALRTRGVCARELRHGDGQSVARGGRAGGNDARGALQEARLEQRVAVGVRSVGGEALHRYEHGSDVRTRPVHRADEEPHAPEAVHRGHGLGRVVDGSERAAC